MRLAVCLLTFATLALGGGGVAAQPAPARRCFLDFAAVPGDSGPGSAGQVAEVAANCRAGDVVVAVFYPAASDRRVAGVPIPILAPTVCDYSKTILVIPSPTRIDLSCVFAGVRAGASVPP